MICFKQSFDLTQGNGHSKIQISSCLTGLTSSSLPSSSPSPQQNLPQAPFPLSTAGSWKERGDLDRELNKWISQYVTEMDNPDPTTRSKRPLRMAKITVSDVEGDPGWYSVSLLARPHFKYMGANFTLSLVGKLDKQ